MQRKFSPDHSSSGMRPQAIALIAILLLFLVVPIGTSAMYVETHALGGNVFTTGELLPPAGLVATHGLCTVGVGPSVNLAWTATTSAIADGYEILRGLTAGGPYTQIATVEGLAAVSYTDSAVLFSTPYFYVVQSKRNNWRSANGSEAALTTLNSLCA